MSTKFIWENLNHPKLAELREEFELEKVVRKGKTDTGKQAILQEWLHDFIPQGTPEKDYYNESALEILRDAKAGKPMWCTQFAFAYLQCAQALGFQVRKLSVDWDHTKETQDHHHGVVDVWSPELQKWYVLDPMNNLMFYHKGIPMSSVEIREQWLKDKAQEMQGQKVGEWNSIFYKEDVTGFDTPSNYFWIYTSLRNNFMTEPGLFNTKGLLWVDEHSKDKRWYRGDGKELSQEHNGYKGQFVEVSDLETLYPKLDS